MKHKKVIQGLCSVAACLTLVSALAGCGTDSLENSSAVSGAAAAASTGEKIIRIAISKGNQQSLLDVTNSRDSITYLNYELIYDPLVNYGDSGQYEPGLAESWEISPDGKEYIFHLRKGVKFSDGSDFNADAMLFNVARWKDKPSTASISVYNNMTGIEKIDDYTVKMTFNKNYYPYLSELTYTRPCRMMSPNSVSPEGDVNGEFQTPIGTGPWMIESCEEGVQTVLVPNPYYWGEKPKVDKLVLKVIKDGDARLMALQSGEVDFSAESLQTEDIQMLAKDENLATMASPGSRGFHLIFNYEKEALQDKKVRQAINYAIDRDSIANNLLEGNGIAAKGMFNAEVVPYVTDANSPGYAFQPEKARQLLKEAGYEDTNGDGYVDKNGENLSLSLLLQNTEYPAWKPVCELVQSQLKEVGIEVNLDLKEQNAYYDGIWTTRDYDMAIYRTYADAWNPHGFLMDMYSASEDTPPVAWDDAKLREMIDQVLMTTEESERQAQYDALFAYIQEESINAPLYYAKNVYGYNKKLTNVQPASTTYMVAKFNEMDVQ